MQFTLVRLLPALLLASAAAAQTFQDVLPNDPLYPYVNTITRLKITNGCSATPRLYCPGRAITRGEAAVLIIRSIMGEDFTTSPNAYFSDVPATHPFFRYIQKMKELGITVGCQSTTDVAARFCMDGIVDRQTMAVFLIRAKLGTNFTFYPVPYFQDVPSSSVYFPFVQKLRELRITLGCSDTSFCATEPVTRGQTAVFLVRAFLT